MSRAGCRRTWKQGRWAQTLAGLLMMASAALSQEPIAPTDEVVVRDGPSSSPVAVDGILDEGAWATAARLTPFVASPDGSVADVQTRVMVSYDAEYVYLGIQCDEPLIARLRSSASGRDDPQMFNDDRVEVLVGSEGAEEFYHGAVNPRGIVFDEAVASGGARRDPAWNGEWAWATGAAPGAWVVEGRVPLASLGISGNAEGSSVLLNVARWRAYDRATSGWVRVGRDVVSGARFGRIELAGPSGRVEEVIFPPFLPGENVFRAEVAGLEAAQPVRLELRLRGGPGRSDTAVHAVGTADPQGVAQLTASFSPLPGQYDLAYTVAAEDHVLVASHAYRFRARAVEALLQRINDNTSWLQLTLRDSELGRAVFGRYQERLDRVAAGRTYIDRAVWFHTQVRPAGLPEWRELEADARYWDREVSRDVLRVRAYQAKPPAVARPDYAVGFADPLTKFAPDAVFDGPLGSEVEVQAARNEAESFQIVLVSLVDREIPIGSIRVTNLRKVDGPGRIHRSNVEVYRQGYVITQRPDYVTDRVGPWPDPLLPQVGGVLPPQGILCYWVTVRVPELAGPGDYVGEIVVRPETSPEWRITLRLHVRSFVLPANPLWTVVASLPPWVINQWEGLDPVDPGAEYAPGSTESAAVLFRHYGKELLREGVSPLEAGWWFNVPASDWTEIVSQTLNEFAEDDKITAYHLGRCDGTWVVPPSEFLASLAGANARGRPISLLFRHPRPTDEAEVQARARRVHQDAQGVATVVVGSPIPQLSDSVDIWAVPVEEWSAQMAAQATAAGKPVWWVVDPGTVPPCANLLVDAPLAAGRILGWLAFEGGIDGLMIDGVLGPDAEVGDGSVFPLFDGANGPGYLLYRARGLRPIRSMRLEVVRDSIEDYQYLTLLRQRLAEARAVSRGAEPTFAPEFEALLHVPREMARGLTDYETDPGPLLRRRERVGEAIETLDAYLSQMVSAE